VLEDENEDESVRPDTPAFDVKAETLASTTSWHNAFSKCRWFTRGWTLQELIAPKVVNFYHKNGYLIGSKPPLLRCISTITGINVSILNHTQGFSSVGIARRMSWAAHRKSSRVEDQAYALLGIFRINMPMLYGEGERAFVHLQEELIRSSTDHSVFAWSAGTFAGTDLLARSPSNYEGGRDLVSWDRPAPYGLSNKRLCITLPVVAEQEASGRRGYLAVLNCGIEDDLRGSLALRLRKYAGREEYYICAKRDLPTQALPLGSFRQDFVCYDTVRRAESCPLCLSAHPIRHTNVVARWASWVSGGPIALPTGPMKHHNADYASVGGMQCPGKRTFQTAYGYGDLSRFQVRPSTHGYRPKPLRHNAPSSAIPLRCAQHVTNA